ncbi:MAG TPA: phosphogluconate dehydrogenase C-terminal domain-containing protein [Terrimicrobiaceae bacterium]|nr:phosphogluconate dehydrogenase C-terminal domain-containing protein [Terrimicrobiaceae bacterium]
MSKPINVTLLGAGGKMGGRVTANLRNLSRYKIAYVEASPERQKEMAARGIETTPLEQALDSAEVVILAVPDRLIGKITEQIVPKMKPGTIVVGLDPAAAYAEIMPKREDITYFVAHPCHPPLFSDAGPAGEDTDWFGGRGSLPQSVVCALHQGPEEHYAIGEQIAADMFAPILRRHRVTIEQMAILEPAVVESTFAGCITVLREAMEAAISMGVPKQAAWDFCLGHIRTELAIIFGFAGFPLSDGAMKAIEQNRPRIFQDNWKDVITIPAVRQSVRDICTE